MKRTNNLPDVSYLDDEKLLEEFNAKKIKAQTLCKPLSDLIRDYQMVRESLDNLAIECIKRGMKVDLN